MKRPTAILLSIGIAAVAGSFVGPEGGWRLGLIVVAMLAIGLASITEDLQR